MKQFSYRELNQTTTIPLQGNPSEKMVFDQEKMQKEKEKLLRINNDMKNIKMAIIIALAIVSCALLLYTWALKRENDLILQENFKTRELLDDTKVKLTECQKSANK